MSEHNYDKNDTSEPNSKSLFRMVSRSLLLLLLGLAALVCSAPAAEEHEAEVSATEPATERFANLSSLTLPGGGDLSFNGSSLMQILVSGGAIVLALVGLVAVLAVVMPLFGFKVTIRQIVFVPQM